jgi:putative phosphoribosyl transferase
VSFEDRTDAGRQLAAELAGRDLTDPLVLGLPRGGVPVAYEVARRLGAPLDVVVVRKVTPPRNPEYGIGAVGEDDVLLLDDEAMGRLGLVEDDLQATIARERAELERRAQRYRGELGGAPVRGRTCVVVDDGLATGVSATAAVRVLDSRGAARIILAVPVGAPDSVERLRHEADEVVCLLTPPSFAAVGTWYHDFTQTTDEEVVDLLARAAAAVRTERDEQIPAGRVSLPADVVLPAERLGVVVFAHGSGSGRKSPRNREVARYLQDAGLATVLFDLLTPREEQVRDNVFDIGLLAARLGWVVRWVARSDDLGGLPVGVFGASTGAAAALVAAAEHDTVGAVVSRGGRVDLADDRLREVHQPTLLLVGGRDLDVLRLNREAARSLAGPHELVVVEGAGHLFEEPGALAEVASAARDWFRRHLG